MALKTQIAATQETLALYDTLAQAKVGLRLLFRRPGHFDTQGTVVGSNLDSLVELDLNLLKFRVAIGTAYTTQVVTVPASRVVKLV